MCAKFESSFELSPTPFQTIGIGKMEVKPVYPDFAWGYHEIYTDRDPRYALRYFINLFSYALPFIESEKNDITIKFYMVQGLHSKIYF